MAHGAIRCTGCNTPLTFHCPDSNVTCTWLACLNPVCRVRYLDVDRGLIQHTDGTILSWSDMPTTTEPPTVTIVGEQGPEAVLPPEDNDGRPPTPDT